MDALTSFCFDVLSTSGEVFHSLFAISIVLASFIFSFVAAVSVVYTIGTIIYEKIKEILS